MKAEKLDPPFDAIVAIANKSYNGPFTIESLKEMLDKPDWAEGGYIHNWRRYVSDDLRKIWGRLSLETRIVVFAIAQAKSDAEDWD